MIKAKFSQDGPFKQVSFALDGKRHILSLDGAVGGMIIDRFLMQFNMHMIR